MVKNVIIGILIVVSIFFFFYGLTQQIKAEHAMELYRRSETESIKLKEELVAAEQDALRQAERAREAERLLVKSEKGNK